MKNLISKVFSNPFDKLRVGLSKPKAKKAVLGLVSLCFVFSIAVVPMLVFAQEDIFGVEYGEALGLGKKDPRETIALIIRVFMGFLGTIAVIIVLLGGFKWMVAGGNEEKVGEAKKLLLAGVIGLVIILSAYAITNFVLTQLISVTNAG
ncbi:MAG TPA: pilin [Patescibacteria group bacterium]